MFDFARALTVGSMVRYCFWKVTESADPLPVTMRGGPRFFLRPGVAPNNDYGVAYEVFIHRHYAPPTTLDPDSVRLVIDIGGNVGLSALQWMTMFPRCRVETFEPNPLHVAQMRKNIALSGQEARIVVHERAAGASDRVARFSNRGASSSALTSSPDGFDAQVVDVLKALRGSRIDVLKLDAEGGEYELLADSRFGELDIGYLVMEWHSRGDGDADRRWCEGRLREMGFTIQPLHSEADHGMFWATRLSGAVVAAQQAQR